MGNVDSRSKFEQGYIILQTAKPFYMPGEAVTGTIFLRTMVPVNVSTIDLEVSGKEKVSFVVRTNRNNDWHDDKHKARRTIMHFHQPAFTFAVSTLAPGDYAIPFTFVLPVGIPSSLLFKNHHVQGHPKDKVKYHLRATLKSQGGHCVMKYKQILMVREPGVMAQGAIKQTSENRLTTWCCVD